MKILSWLATYGVAFIATAGVLAQSINVMGNAQEAQPETTSPIAVSETVAEVPTGALAEEPATAKEETSTKPSSKPIPTVEGGREDCKAGAVACSTQYYETHPEAKEYDKQDPYWYINPPMAGRDAGRDPEEYREEIRWLATNQIHTVDDYIDYFAGVCPSQQSGSPVMWEDWRYLAALGVHSAHKSYQLDVERAWNEYKHGVTGTQFVGSFAFWDIEPNRYGPPIAPEVAINWDTFTAELRPVSEDYREQFDKVTYPASWYQRVQEVEDYARELEARYNALCPND